MLVERLHDLARVGSVCKCDTTTKSLSVSLVTHSADTYCIPLASSPVNPLASLGELIPLALAALGRAGVSKTALRLDAPVGGLWDGVFGTKPFNL